MRVKAAGRRRNGGNMRKNRKNNVRKERIIMIASSAFVLAALTMTGVYMKDKSNKVKDDGYSIDFSALEDNVDDKYQEIAQNDAAQNNIQQDVQLEDNQDTSLAQNPVTEDDLDYAPLEAGSNLVTIPGVTDQEQLGENAGIGEQANAGEVSGEEDKSAQEDGQDEDAASEKVTVSKALHFSEENGLARPAAGEILMHYSMDSSIYFATLDQYKYNPAVMITAAEGDTVTVCADAKVVSVFENEEIGKAVTLDLGDGYQATYGQLKDIQVSEGSYVDRGEILGYAAAPTKYYSVEGGNVYFQLTRDEVPVNPENLFQ